MSITASVKAMKVDDCSLNDEPFSKYFVISFPFPKEERAILRHTLQSIPNSVLDQQLETPNKPILEENLADHLQKIGYAWSKREPKECQLWQPDHKNELDFYNKEKRIGIEVEKTEVKRIVHDVLKLVNGSLTFVPKIRYGVLIIPRIYKRKSGKESAYYDKVIRDLLFYFQQIIPKQCGLHDLLLLVYDS